VATEDADRTRPIVILLHGAGLNRAMWQPQLENLGKEHKVVAVDLPGHGQLRNVGFTLDAAIEQVEDTIAQEKSGPAVIVGSSLGGYVAIAYAAKHNKKVAGLVLSGCCVQYFGIIGAVARANVFAMRFTPRFLFEEMQKKMLASVAAPADVEAIVQNGLSISGAQDGMKEVIGKDFVAMFGRCDAPVLLLNGERDTLNRKHESLFVQTSREVKRSVVAGAGHLCSLERPGEFSEIVGQFIKQVTVPPSLTSSF
jgi:pimeloyl-ACP methyl ester carboxylesterase